MISQDVIYQTLLDHFPIETTISIGEAVIDEYPLFLYNDNIVSINDHNSYISRFMSLVGMCEDSSSGIWRLSAAVCNDSFVQREWDKIKSSRALGAWQKYVVACDYIEGFDKFTSCTNADILRDTTQNIIECANAAQYVQHISQRIVNLTNIVDVSVKQYIDNTEADIIYLDCSRESIPEDALDSVTKPVLLLSKRGEYKLDSWDRVSIDNLDIVNNFAQVLKNGISRAECE
jgi:hypothetical protein